MRLIKKFDRYITVLFITTIIAISATSYFTFEKIIRGHIKHQQAATIPLFSLITSEVIRPLSISSFMANDSFLIHYANTPELNNEQLLKNYLGKLSTKYNMLTFVALEKHGFMLDSDNKKSPLTHEKAEWYHRLKQLPAEQYADIGNLEDPHIYFDIKLRNDQGEFLGFVGVGVDLNYFANAFKNYNDSFGIDLLFVDEKNDIILTSNHLMKTDKHHRSEAIININTLPWYKRFVSLAKKNSNDSSNVLIDLEDDESVVVSRLPIPEISWQVFIVSPPENQQRKYWQEFGNKLFVIFLVALVLYFLFDFTVSYFKSKVVEDSETDYLTQLPNRAFVNWRYEEMQKEHTHASVVMADIDHFKVFNDEHGHLVGDDVLKMVAKKIKQNVRDIDVVGRWGGEEFVMILPDTDIDLAHKIIERLRMNIQNTQFQSRNKAGSFQVTLSFGIVHSPITNISLDTVLSRADIALYRAKNNGRNQVSIEPSPGI